MSTQRVAYLVYQGAVYKEALDAPKQQVPKKDLRTKFEEPTPTQKAPVSEKAQKWKRRYETPDPEAGKAVGPRLDKYMEERERESPPQLTDKLKQEPIEIALNYKKIAPIWFALSDKVTELEKRLNEEAQEKVDGYAKQLLQWFAALARKSDHADVRAIGRILPKIENAHFLFSYDPPVYKQMRRYFDEGRKESDTAVRGFIRKINEVAKAQGWNIRS